MFRLRALAVLGGLVSACTGTETGAAGPLAVPDDRGDTVRLARPATRIVSLAPSHTDLLFAIGAGDRLVGRTKWASHPPEALRVPDVGDGLAPNVEAIAARRPDLVVTYAAAANATAVTQLHQLGIPVFALRMDRLADVPRAARLLGRLTGTGGPAGALAARFAAGLDSARATARRDTIRPRVLLVAWDQPPIVIGGGSFQSEIVWLAGGRNVFDDVEQPSVQVSIETIAARRPEVIVRLGAEGIPDWARRPEWQVVDAVRGERFIGVTGSAFEHPSVRALEAVRRLAARLAERVR